MKSVFNGPLLYSFYVSTPGLIIPNLYLFVHVCIANRLCHTLYFERKFVFCFSTYFLSSLFMIRLILFIFHLSLTFIVLRIVVLRRCRRQQPHPFSAADLV